MRNIISDVSVLIIYLIIYHYTINNVGGFTFSCVLHRSKNTIHLSVVACGERLEETLVMIKSAIILTIAPLHVHIFAEDALQPTFKQQVGCVCNKYFF